MGTYRRPETLSKEPEAIRRRLRKSNKSGMRDLQMLAEASRKPLDQWDMEELARGRPRAEDGSFRGPAPKWITPVIVLEAKRRLQIGALATMGSMVADAIKVVYDMMNDTSRDDDGRPIVDSKTRLACAMFIIDHVLGKPKQRVEMEAEGGFRSMLAKALIMRDRETGELTPAHPVIDLQAEDWTDDDDA